MGFLRKIFNYFFVYLVVIFIFSFLVVTASIIPSSLTNSHIKDTASTLKNEGMYPSVGISWRKIALDNFTESMLLNVTYSINSKNPVQSAFQDIRYDNRTIAADQILSLEQLSKGKKDLVPVGYERYWNGYITYLRPLFVFFSYENIRIIISILLYGGFAIFSYLAVKKLGFISFVPLLIGFIAVDFFYIGKSIQFSDIFLVALYSGIYLLYRYPKVKDLYLFFFIVGACTSFVDLLTAPLVSLGLILILVHILKKQKIRTLFLYCVSWSLGYLLLWGAKWVLSDILVTHGAIFTAFNEIADRTNRQVDPNFTRLNTIKLNFFQLRGYDKRNKIVLLATFLLLIGPYLYYFKISLKKLMDVLPYVFIAIIPYAWYFIAASHSYIHVWFTYRDQFMTVAAGAIIAFSFVDWKRVRKDGEKISEFIKSKKTSY